MKSSVCNSRQKVWAAPTVTVALAKAAENGTMTGNYDTVPFASGHYHLS